MVNISVTRLNSTAVMLPSDGKGLRIVSIMLSMGKPWPQDPEIVANSGFIRIASGKLEGNLKVDIEETKNFASSISLELGQKPPIESFPRPDLSSMPNNHFNIWTRIGPFLNLRPNNAVGFESNESKSVAESFEMKTDGKEIEPDKKRLSMNARPKQIGASVLDKSGRDSHAKTAHGRLAEPQPEKTATPKTIQGPTQRRRYVNRCLATTAKRRHIGDVSTAAGEMKASSKVKLPASGEIRSQSTAERSDRNEDVITNNQRHVTNGSSSPTTINEPTDKTEAHDLLILSTKATKTSNDPVKQANVDSENETPFVSTFPSHPKERIKPLSNTLKRKLGKENLVPEYKMSRDFAESIVAREVKPDDESLMEANWPSKFQWARPTADVFVGKGYGEDGETVNDTKPLFGPTSMPPIENANSENDAMKNVTMQLVTKFDIFKDMLDKALAKFDDDDDDANENQLKSNGNLEIDREGVEFSSLDDDLETNKGSDGDDSRTSLLREVGHIVTQLDSLGMLWNAMKPSLKLLSRSDAGKVLDAIVDIIQMDDRTDFELDNRTTVADESNQLSGYGEEPNDRRGGNRSKSLQSTASETDGAAAAAADDHRRHRRGQPRRRRSADGSASEVDGQKTKGAEELDDDIVRDDDFARVMEERDERTKRRGSYDDYIFGENPGFVLEHQKRDVASDQMEEDAISRELANLLIEKVYNRLLKKVETPGGEKTASASEQRKKKERAKRSVKQQDKQFVKRDEGHY